MTQTKNLSHEHFPFIEGIEESLLKAFMQDRKMWVDFKEHIMPEYFNQQAHTNIFKILRVYFDRYLDFPTVEICTDIAAKKVFGDATARKIITIYDRPDLLKKELEYLYDECSEFIKNNKIKNAILESVELLEGRKFVEIEEKIKIATSWNNSIELGTNFSEAESRLQALEELNSNVIRTPWMSLNQSIGGGFFAKELVIIASSSSVGKSIMLDNCATYAWRKLKKNVLSITLELSEVRKSQRMDAEVQDINAAEVLEHKTEIIKYFKDNPMDNQLRIKEFPTASVNINHLKQYVYQLELYTGFKPDVMFIDYLDIMLPKRRTNDTYEDQGSIGAELRGWAIELAIPIVTASQNNRLSKSVTVEELDERHLADSYKKLMIADTLIFLINTPEERIAGKINVKIGKARNGIKDIFFPLRVDYPKLKICNLCSAKSIQGVANGTNNTVPMQK